ncbi:MAG TPA: protein-export chaperone SecB [Prolixibacteraceae bacterium]|nr:protein-export chaperone SecB [Prolixibacteraceae bacterium]
MIAKPKISPEEYRKILETLDLDTIYVSELNSRFKDECLSPSLKLHIDEKNSFVQENNILKVVYTFKLAAKDDTMEEPGISLTVKYVVRYQVNKEVTITKEFMQVFSDLTIGMLLWTYFRELVNNMVYRMGMPPLVLPLKKR